MSTVVLLRQGCLGCGIRGWNGDLKISPKIAGEFVKRELKRICNTQCWENIEQLALSHTTGGSVKCCDHLENSVTVSIKAEHLQII